MMTIETTRIANEITTSRPYRRAGSGKRITNHTHVYISKRSWDNRCIMRVKSCSSSCSPFLSIQCAKQCLDRKAEPHIETPHDDDDQWG